MAILHQGEYCLSHLEEIVLRVSFVGVGACSIQDVRVEPLPNDDLRVDLIQVSSCVQREHTMFESLNQRG